MMTLAAQEKKQMVYNWNRKYIPGQKVKVKTGPDSEIVTTTTSNAELIGGSTPVIKVSGETGYYALDRVTPIS